MKVLVEKDLMRLSGNQRILFAVFCAEQVFHLIRQEHKEICLNAIDTSKMLLEGKATRDACKDAYNIIAAAHKSTNDVNYSRTAAAAAAAAANTAHAAAYNSTAYAAVAAAINAANYYNSAADTKLPIIEKQWVYYDQLLNSDKYFEEIVLKS
jgi:hypothetical protein